VIKEETFDISIKLDTLLENGESTVKQCDFYLTSKIPDYKWLHKLHVQQNNFNFVNANLAQ